MTHYERGFLTKCAEYGISDSMTEMLCKKAGIPWSTVWKIGAGVLAGGGATGGIAGYVYKNRPESEFTKSLSNMANRARETAYLGGYEAFLPKELQAGTMNKPGTMFGRLIHGSDYYQRYINDKLDKARAAYAKLYGAVPTADTDPGRNATRAIRREMADYARLSQQYNNAKNGLTPQQLELLKKNNQPFTAGLNRDELGLLQRYGVAPGRKETLTPPYVYDPGKVGY